MHDKHSQTPELEQLAAQLAALTPRTEFDRDKLMFAAGRRAGRRKLVAVNRLLGACCVLLAVAAILPLAMPQRSSMVAGQAPRPTVQATELASNHVVKALPNQLVAADSRELAASIAEGRGDLRPARLREGAEPPSNETGPSDSTTARPKPSRELMREYLESEGEYL